MRAPHDPAKLIEFGTLHEPGEAQEPILARPVRDALLEWIIEIGAQKELQSVGIGPRRRALFDGAPGVGKTTLAHHLCARIGLRMLAIRPERIIDCWVGSSSRNLGALFDMARDEKEPVVLFFVEIDALAAKRQQVQQASDQHRNEMVNTLLQRIDGHDGFIIAATNHGKGIDPAIWRRFDIQVELALPGQDEREHILARYLKPFILPAHALQLLAKSLETATPALMRQFCECIKRQLVIGPKVKWDMRKERVIDRLLASVQPHAECGKPALWAHGSSDEAIRALPWPLSTEVQPEQIAVNDSEPANVLQFHGGPRA
jgi:hypothetical protein